MSCKAGCNLLLCHLNDRSLADQVSLHLPELPIATAFADIRTPHLSCTPGKSAASAHPSQQVSSALVEGAASGSAVCPLTDTETATPRAGTRMTGGREIPRSGIASTATRGVARQRAHGWQVHCLGPRLLLPSLKQQRRCLRRQRCHQPQQRLRPSPSRRNRRWTAPRCPLVGLCVCSEQAVEPLSLHQQWHTVRQQWHTVRRRPASSLQPDSITSTLCTSSYSSTTSSMCCTLC